MDTYAKDVEHVMFSHEGIKTKQHLIDYLECFDEGDDVETLVSVIKSTVAVLKRDSLVS